MDASSLIPLMVALAAGGGVALYMAKANKESVSVKTALDAVGVVDRSMKQLEKDLQAARDRIVVLETLNEQQVQDGRECRVRIQRLSEAIRRLGGTVDDLGDVQDGGDRG